MLARRLIALIATLAALLIAPASFAQDAGNVVVLETNRGEIRIQLAADVAPGHAERITTLARQGFYDGVVFHRVIEGFMAQSGDPTGTGSGGSELPDLKAEFSSVPFRRGVVGMARAQNPDSANSQFFIMFGDAPHLNGQYTVVGQVVDGMDVVDSLKKGERALNGQVSDPDRIEHVRVEADQ